MTVGIAYLQALTGRRLKQLPPRRSAGAETKTVSPSEFLHACRLFRLIVQHVETMDLAELLREDLAKARQALRVFEQVQTRLRKELKTVLPAMRNPPPVPRPESRREQLVRAVLDHIHHHCAQPLTLQKCAGELQVNAAYLSHLFSDTVGLSFKTCLTEVRIEKARELLSNPANTVSRVARAVGYASANRFRFAFRKVTGVPPRNWREILRMNPPAPPNPLR